MSEEEKKKIDPQDPANWPTIKRPVEPGDFQPVKQVLEHLHTLQRPLDKPRSVRPKLTERDRFEITAYAFVGRIHPRIIPSIHEKVLSMPKIIAEKFGETLLRELQRYVDDETLSPLLAALQEWIIAYDKGHPTAQAAGQKWDAYTAKQEEFLDYLFDNAADIQETEAGRYTIQPNDLKTAQERNEESRRLLAEFLVAVQTWQTERQKRLAKQRRRRGKRLVVKPADSVRAVTAESGKNALVAIAKGAFLPVEGAPAIWTEHEGTQVRIECDTEAGFGVNTALNTLARHGASVTQTYIAMAGLWMQKCPVEPYDNKITASVTDLMRFMRRRTTSGGGYNNDDIMARGRDVYVLMNTNVHKARTTTWPNGKPKDRELEVVRLAIIESLAAQLPIDGSNRPSVVEFKYHLGEEMHEWLCGRNPQYVEVSGKLLEYNPLLQEYHILLGLALAFYDRVNRKQNKLGPRRLKLTALLNLAAKEVPAKNTARFFGQVQKALADLDVDGVIPKVKLILPDPEEAIGMSAREQISAAEVEFPALLLSALPAPTGNPHTL